MAGRPLEITPGRRTQRPMNCRAKPILTRKLSRANATLRRRCKSACWCPCPLSRELIYGAGEAIRDGVMRLPILRDFRTVSCFREEAWRSATKEGALEFSERTRFFRRDGFCAGWEASRRGRIAGNDVIVSDCAALG